MNSLQELLAQVSGSKRPEQGHHHTKYSIDVIVPHSNRSWTIYRKYYEFKRLSTALYHLSFPGPRLPPRQLWGPRTKQMLDRRVESLDMWLQGTLAIWKSFYSPGYDQDSLTVSTLMTVFLCKDSEFQVTKSLIRGEIEQFGPQLQQQGFISQHTSSISSGGGGITPPEKSRFKFIVSKMKQKMKFFLKQQPRTTTKEEEEEEDQQDILPMLIDDQQQQQQKSSFLGFRNIFFSSKKKLKKKKTTRTNKKTNKNKPSSSSQEQQEQGVSEDSSDLQVPYEKETNFGYIELQHEQQHSSGSPNSKQQQQLTRMLSFTDDDGSELEWVFDSEEEEDIGNNETDIYEKLFLGEIVDFQHLNEANSDIERLFTVTVMVPSQGGKDLLRDGYGMVSVPPTPKSRELFRKPWKAYTDKLLYHVCRRLDALALINQQQPPKSRSSSGDAAEWIDSGSEEGGSEAGEDGCDDIFFQRAKWLEETNSNNDNDFDCGSWASEAANDSFDGGNDRDIVGSWEEGTMWVGPKREPVGVDDEEEDEFYKYDGSFDDEETNTTVNTDDDDEEEETSNYQALHHSNIDEEEEEYSSSAHEEEEDEYSSNNEGEEDDEINQEEEKTSYIAPNSEEEEVEDSSSEQENEEEVSPVAQAYHSSLSEQVNEESDDDDDNNNNSEEEDEESDTIICKDVDDEGDRSSPSIHSTTCTQNVILNVA